MHPPIRYVLTWYTAKCFTSVPPSRKPVAGSGVWTPLTIAAPYLPACTGSSDGHSTLRPQRGSRCRFNTDEGGVRAIICACVSACNCACVCACVRAFVRACVCDGANATTSLRHESEGGGGGERLGRLNKTTQDDKLVARIRPRMGWCATQLWLAITLTTYTHQVCEARCYTHQVYEARCDPSPAPPGC